jgi:hypothetical protein
MVDTSAVKAALRHQAIELPSWAFANSGTRFKVFAQEGVPRTPEEKIADAGVELLRRDFDDWGCEPGCATVAADGVYFMNREGCWRTVGGIPEKISQAIDPTSGKNRITSTHHCLARLRTRSSRVVIESTTQ